MAIVVDQPIVSSPFEEPRHYCRVRGGTTELVETLVEEELCRLRDVAGEPPDRFLVIEARRRTWL